MPASEFEAEALVRILADSVIIAKTFSLHDTMHRTGCTNIACSCLLKNRKMKMQECFFKN
jgi:hypothetical protein